MTYKEEFLKTKLTDYCNQYKAVASLSILAIAKNDVVLIKKLHKNLKKIFDTTMSFLEPLCSKSIISKLKNMDLSSIPQSMESLKIIDSYQKILSLKYTKVETDNIEDKIYLNKIFPINFFIPSLSLSKIPQSLYPFLPQHFRPSATLC